MKILSLLLLMLSGSISILATDYHVGPGQALTTISEVPWATLQAGDRVYIYWKNTPYKEKWVINRQGTAANRIEIIGVNGPGGEQAVIDGDDALTVAGVNYWNESRGVIKIGGSSIPADGLPSYITIENLEIRSGRPAYQFTNDNGQVENYVNNAAAIYVEKASHLIIRNCTLHDSGNGLFIGAFDGLTEDILIEENYIYDNGIVGRFFEHNAYTAAINITYQFNRFGPLRPGADGNNLKDRSAGLVVRYNWIEGGNRQLDLVDAEDSQALVNHPSYPVTHVYGNMLIEPDGDGNSQIVHYGGDSGTTSDYRKGDLYLYNNTIISTRTGNTTLVRLSTSEETAHVFNNVIYTTASGNHFAMINGDGTFNMHHNWLKTGWVDCHCTPSGMVNDLGNNITGTDPLFEDFGNQLFALQSSSPLVNSGDVIPAALLPEHDIAFEYIKHQGFAGRLPSGNIDIGAYEYISPLAVDLLYFKVQLWQTGKTIRLEWQTASENNNQGFEIYRRSDNDQWSKIGEQKGKGNSSRLMQYAFIDKNPHRGINYYRIKQINYDGTFEYSPTESILFDRDRIEVRLFPNPAKNWIAIESKVYSFEKYKIYNSMGQLIQSDSWLNGHRIDLSNLSKGLYILSLVAPEGGVEKMFFRE